MKVIIVKPVNNIGQVGEIKNVSAGYAQNFLIPKGYALPATKENIAKVQKIKTGKKIKVVGKKLNHNFSNLNNLTLTFRQPADDQGTLFAKISKEKIKKELLSMGYNVKDKDILLAQPIKSLGERKVEIKNANNQKMEIKIIIQKI